MSIDKNANRPLSRRAMLRSSSCGFGMIALNALLSREACAADFRIKNPRPDRKAPALRARAKRVIFLCMSGGPAHLDTFDYKPQTGKAAHPGSVFPFRRRGESGLWISDLFPETAKHADKLCVLNGMYADTGNHAQSFLQLHTGERLRRRPSMGAWVGYGLGTENANLPGFVSMNAHESSVSSSAFLPSEFGGTSIGVNGEDMSLATIPNVVGDHLSPQAKRRQLDMVQSMNREHAAARSDDARLESVIRTMELGFRMQVAAPELLDLRNEPQAVLDRYRVGNKISVGNCRPSDFGRQCLLARRFAEAGVRFIEIAHGGWDQHTNHRRDLQANCESTDAPIAALLEDLEQRGLLDDTLIVWGGEFGRPGLKPGEKTNETGHNPKGFTFWLAGGGVTPGVSYGSTDETGSRAVDGKMHFHDLHATILHLLGLEHDKLTFHHQGREHRLTGPKGGVVARGILA